MRSFLLASFALLTMVVVGCDPAETPKTPAETPKVEPGPKPEPGKPEEGKMAPKAEEGKMAPTTPPAEAPKTETPK